MTYYQDWYLKNKEKVRKYHQKYYQENKEQYLKRDKEYRKKESYKIWLKKYRKLHDKEYIKNNPEKYKAGKKMRNLLATKRINRLPCQICNNKKTSFHHPDYSKPFEVYHLCAKHHKSADMGELELKNIILYNYIGYIRKNTAINLLSE